MGKPSPPPAPDYAAAANQQGQANVNSAIATNFLNQANQVGPNGSLNYTYDYAGGYTDPQTGRVIPRTTATTTLSPEQQRLYDQNTQISGALNDLASRGIGYVDQASRNPIDQSRLPGLTFNLGTPSYQTGLAATQPIQSNYDFSGAGAMPRAEDFQGQRDQITEAYMQRLKPYLDQQRQSMDTKLANQGITSGSEAWKYDVDALNRGQNDQRIAALLAGDQQQQNLFNNAMGIRQQGTNEAMAQGNFHNQAQGQEFSQGLASMDATNRAQDAQFRAGLAGGQFNNQARQQAIQEADYFNNQPLNMLNALRSGNQVSMPTFGNATAGSNIGAAPIYQATSDQYQSALQRYQAQLQASGGLLGGIASLGSAAISHWSDRRLKTKIKRIGRLASGLGVYVYNYIWGGPRQVGVMADEVLKIKPEALGPTINGFHTVNYGAL
jgi:hypothetical protein